MRPTALTTLLLTASLSGAPLTAPGLLAQGGGTPNSTQRGAVRRAPITVIDDVQVVDVEKQMVTPNRRVVLRGDSVLSVGAMSERLPDTVDVRVEGRGGYLIPGLVDHHVHLTPGMSRALTQTARGGVTMVNAMAGDNRTAGEYARAVLARELPGPEIAYASVMAGPDFFVDPRFRGASVGFAFGTAPWAQAVTSSTDVVRAVSAARGSGAEVLKLYAMIDSTLAARLIAEAHRQGMRVVAHGTVFPARPSQLVAGGVDILTHVPYLSWQGATTAKPEDAFNRANGPYEQVPADAPAIESLLQAMRTRGTFLEPTLEVFVGRPTTAPVMRAWSLAVTRRAHTIGIPILAGTDGMIGNDADALPNIHKELARLVEAGLSPAAALASATIVPARAMGRGKTHGTVAAGRVADLVLLDANPLIDISATTRIRQVFLKGQAVRTP
ncbi:amidohydrolase family protein [Gemmatimonas aurantiaca]|nr:amidohydrolase family protein [Gemmatimonas aurantiaca]